MKRMLALILGLSAASPAGAHPHIFVDTGFDLRFDAEGRLIEVRTTWAYDEFYSLLIMEDRGLDQDFDGVLTPEEQADLTGFDMQWTEGFNGDLEITQDGNLLTLTGPKEATAVYREGRIITTHLRRLDPEQQNGARIDIKPYDATYYTAYTVSYPIRLLGTDSCDFDVTVPDIDAGLRALSAELSALDMDTSPEEAGLPDIGGLLATTVSISCDIS